MHSRVRLTAVLSCVEIVVSGALKRSNPSSETRTTDTPMAFKDTKAAHI